MHTLIYSCSGDCIHSEYIDGLLFMYAYIIVRCAATIFAVHLPAFARIF